MNTLQLRKLIDNAPLLKVGDRELCETLLKSRSRDLETMVLSPEDAEYLSREASRKAQDIINTIQGA